MQYSSSSLVEEFPPVGNSFYHCETPCHRGARNGTPCTRNNIFAFILVVYAGFRVNLFRGYLNLLLYFSLSFLQAYVSIDIEKHIME